MPRCWANRLYEGLNLSQATKNFFLSRRSREWILYTTDALRVPFPSICPAGEDPIVHVLKYVRLGLLVFLPVSPAPAIISRSALGVNEMPTSQSFALNDGEFLYLSSANASRSSHAVC